MRNDLDRALLKNPDYPPGCNSRELAELGWTEDLSDRERTDSQRRRIEDQIEDESD